MGLGIEIQQAILGTSIGCKDTPTFCLGTIYTDWHYQLLGWDSDFTRALGGMDGNQHGNAEGKATPTGSHGSTKKGTGTIGNESRKYSYQALGNFLAFYLHLEAYTYSLFQRIFPLQFYLYPYQEIICSMT